MNGISRTVLREQVKDLLLQRIASGELKPSTAIAAAIGLAAGALLPKTKRETELLGSVGKRLTGVAAGAAEAARDAAKAELGSLPLSKDAAKAQVSKLIDQVAKAVSSAGEAALNGSPVAAAEIKPAKKSK